MQDGLNLARPRRHKRRLRGGGGRPSYGTPPNLWTDNVRAPDLFFLYAAHIPWNIFRQQLPWTPQTPTHTARRLLLSESSRPVITAAKNG